MIRLFLKAALRNLKRSPLNTTINILGLALGFTVALISTLWVLKQFLLISITAIINIFIRS